MFTTAHNEPGGCARHSSLLTSGLAARGWRVLAFGRGAGLRRFSVVRSGTHQQLEVPGLGLRAGVALYITLSSLLALGASLRRPPDAVLVFQMGGQLVAGGITALLVRRPLVVMSTLSGPAGDIALVANARFRFLHRAFVRRASCVVGQTEVAAEELTRLAPCARIVVLPNPSPVRGPVPLTDQPSAAFVGRFAEAKDLPVLLRAWRLVVDEHPSARLTLIGADDPTQPIEADLREVVAADEHLARSVKFAGWVQDVPSLLAEHDVFVLASRHEGLSNALLEACGLGRIAVVSDILPNLAVVGVDYPLTFPVGDANRLAATILSAFQNDEVRMDARQQISERMDRFHPDTVLVQLEEILETAAASSKLER